MSFASTKIEKPRLRGDVVPRPQLARRLGGALAAARLVLLCAPAGYGKTTALLAQLSAAQAPHCVWISCDEDDDLTRLAACLVTALDPLDLPWRCSSEALIGALDGSRTARERFAHELVNALSACELARGLLVIDDLHRISDPQVSAFLDALLEYLPPQWGLVIASRIDPALALARWRARGELEEFRQTELSFSVDEAQSLVERLRAATDDAEPADVLARQLVERSGGWVAGMRLGLSSGQDLPARYRSQRHLVDYLASEVLHQMPAELQRFLTHCSLLRELDAQRCAEVCEEPQAAHWLEEIERRGLFVSVLKDDPLVLRLHDLFRDFLEQRLRREHAQDLPGLLLRAAAAEADPGRRVSLLMQAGATEEAEQVLLTASPLMLRQGELPQLQRSLELFTPERRSSSAVLSFVQGLCAWPRWDWQGMQQAMARCVALAGPGTPPGLLPQALAFNALGLISLNRFDDAAAQLELARVQHADRDTEALTELIAALICFVQGPPEGTGLHLQRMVELLEQGADAQVWYRCAPYQLFLGRPGAARAIRAYVEGALRVAGADDTPLLATAHVLQAHLHLWRGEVEAAREALALAQADSRWIGMPRSLRIGGILGTQLRLAALDGDLERFRELVAETLADGELDQPHQRVIWLSRQLAGLGQLAAGLGDDQTLQLLQDTLDRHGDKDEWPLMQHARAGLQAVSLLRAGRLADVCERLVPLLADLGREAMPSTEALVRTVLARAQLGCGQVREAWRSLEPLLLQARASGEVLGLLSTGSEALSALATAAWGVEAGRPELAWLGELAGQAKSPHNASPLAARTAPARAPAAAHGLSTRECEVLEHIAAGDSNKLIARALDLSLHTVKRHVANILDKTALSSRGQVAAWWLSQPRR